MEVKIFICFLINLFSLIFKVLQFLLIDCVEFILIELLSFSLGNIWFKIFLSLLLLLIVEKLIPFSKILILIVGEFRLFTSLLWIVFLLLLKTDSSLKILLKLSFSKLSSFSNLFLLIFSTFGELNFWFNFLVLFWEIDLK